MSNIVTIIIPNYNNIELLKKTLNSIYKYYNDTKTIVVDNNSKEDVQKIIKCFDNVELINLDKNYGFAKAVNEGIKLSNSEFVVLLNNDVEVEKGWLESLLDLIKNDEKIFSVSSKMIQYNDRTKIDDAGDEYTILGYTIKRGNNEYTHNFNTDKEIFSSCAGAAIYRKKIFDKIGYFDEEFFAYMEDVDIGFRARIYGYKNMYCSSAVVYHIGSATTGSKYNSFKVRTAARNNIFLIYKNMPILMLLLNLPFLILGFLIKTLFFILKGYGKDYIKGLFDGLKGIKRIKKIKFNSKNTLNYIKIELKMIYNTFYYPVLKLKR